MAKVRCIVCRHPQSAEIDKALAMHGASLSSVAQMFGVNSATLGNHQKKCVPTFLAAVEQSSRESRGLNVKEAVFKGSDMVYRLMDACHDWLRDTDDPTKYNLDPRDNEINVVYLDHNDLDARGNPTRKTATLRALLEQVSVNGIEPKWTKPATVDIRTYALQTIGKLNETIEFYAKLCGLLQQERKNEFDEREFFKKEIERLQAEGWEYEQDVQILLAADDTGLASQYIN